jgi:hypothetical protein
MAGDWHDRYTKCAIFGLNSGFSVSQSWYARGEWSPRSAARLNPPGREDSS